MHCTSLPYTHGERGITCVGFQSQWTLESNPSASVQTEMSNALLKSISYKCGEAIFLIHFSPIKKKH